MTVLASGNVGIGDSTPNSLLTVGTGDAFQVDNNGNVSTTGSLTVTGLSTFNNSLVAGATATGTVSNTEPTPRTNVTNVITTTAVFANNDVIFINNAGQDYYTRVVSGGGTTNLVVSPAVSYDASATVTKYQVQNIGATATNYSSQTNRFFQGYFLGGVVIGAGSTTISDGNIDSTTTLHLQQNGGALEIGGTLSVAGAITGDGSGLTNINGAQITSGSIADTSLSSNVTLAGNSFNGANQLVQLNGSGALPVLSGTNLTNLSGSNITTGTLSDSILSSNVTLAGNTFNGASQLLRLNAGGKVDDSLLSTNITVLGNSFNGINQLVQLNGSGALPALSGSNLTNLNASNIATGTIGDTRLSGNVTLAGNTFNGINQLVQLNGSGSLPVISGANLTNLNATNITSGTLDNARLNSSVTTAGNVFNGVSQLVQLNASGQLPALSAVNLTNLNASNIASGTLSDSRLSGNVTLAGNSFNGISQLLQLNTSGKVDDSLLSTNITAQGNTFNGINQLVQLNASGALPALSGANLTSINGSNISSGTINNSRLSASVTLAGNSFNGVSQLVQLNASGALPALSGANLTSLSASNITSGTLDNARLNTNVTTAGNTFNGVSQLVQLNASGQLPALSGVNLTNINASNIASGTLSDTRLSGNVTLAGNSFNGVSQLVQLNASGALPVLSGVNLTNLNASNISSGTLDNARLTSSVTLAGNTFNGVSQLVQLNASGALPSLNAANLTSLNATSIASGTLSDTRLSGNVTLAGNSFNGVSQLVQLNASGALPVLSGVNLTNLNASNISSGTLDNARLTSSVTLAGNTFNGVSQLVQLNASGALPSLSGINLTSLNASNIASGTLNDGRLSGNVVLLNANQIFTGTNQFNSSLTANGAASFNGNTTIGDASGDIITLNSSTMTLNNNLNIGSNSLYIDSTNKWLGINTASAQNRLTINTPNTSDAAAQVFIYTNANANKGLVVQGTASQSGNLQEWQLSGGSAPTIVNSAGQIVSSLNLAATGLANNVSSNNSLVQTTTTGTIVSTALASSVTLTLQNTNASPTGDLLQLKNSGGVAISQFNSSGQLILGNDAATPVAGVIQLNDATAANSFRINLSTASNLTASRNITLPDEAGTVCLSNSNNCGYIRLASGAAQTDSTTNDSIYINKTGASGDLITLQKNAVDVFRVANDGSLEIRQTSTTALSIKNSGGTDFFGVDTSGAIVRIGSATADGTGTLLVLDTKNTTGDPAGVNGGSYYNSADGKSRCYENGTWSDCSTTRVAGETTLGAASATISVSLNGNYEYLECRVDIKSRSVANMVYVRFNNDTGAAAYGWNAYGIVAAAPVDWQDASDSEIQLPGTQTGTNPFSADLKITNFADTNKVVDWTAAGVEPVNTNSNRYSGVGGYYNTTAQITSVQFVSSGGTFAAGSHAWCQGKNIR